jgi:hypothetical protein
VYDIFIDNEESDGVRAGEHVDFSLPAGTHDIFVRIDWCGSPTVEVTIEPDATTILVAQPAGRFWTAFVRPRRYLALEHVDATPKTRA